MQNIVVLIRRFFNYLSECLLATYNYESPPGRKELKFQLGENVYLIPKEQWWDITNIAYELMYSVNEEGHLLKNLSGFRQGKYWVVTVLVEELHGGRGYTLLRRASFTPLENCFQGFQAHQGGGGDYVLS